MIHYHRLSRDSLRISGEIVAIRKELHYSLPCPFHDRWISVIRKGKTAVIFTSTSVAIKFFFKVKSFVYSL
jgi:hypothetical protein